MCGLSSYIYDKYIYANAVDNRMTFRVRVVNLTGWTSSPACMNCHDISYNYMNCHDISYNYM